MNTYNHDIQRMIQLSVDI